MKQKIVLGITVGLILVLSQLANAESLDFSSTKWEISGQVGGAFPKDDDTDTGLLLLGRITYDIAPNLGLGATVGWSHNDVNVDSVNLGKVNSVPLLATLVYRVPIEAMENRLVPYVVGGLGVSFWSFDEGSVFSSSGASFDNKSAFAAQIGGGVDYYFYKNSAIFGEVSYFFNDVHTTLNAPGVSVSGKVNNDAVFLGAGLKTRF